MLFLCITQVENFYSFIKIDLTIQNEETSSTLNLRKTQTHLFRLKEILGPLGDNLYCINKDTIRTFEIQGYISNSLLNGHTSPQFQYICKTNYCENN